MKEPANMTAKQDRVCVEGVRDFARTPGALP